MAISDENLRKVQAWLNKYLDGACKICQGRKFSYQDMIVIRAVFCPSPDEVRESANPTYMIPVTCATCWHTIFLAHEILSGPPP